VKLLVAVLDGAGVFADVIDGAARPATVRVRTMARTNVLFMGSPGTTSTLMSEIKILALPDAYNLSGI
jgi:hypothetical protein